MTMATSKVPPKYVIRHMVMDDIDQVMDIWKKLDLEEAKHSLHTWLQVDPQGFFVAADDDQGLIYGMCCGVITQPDFAFIGMYAVRKEYQGLGIGLKMWNAMMEHVGDRNAGLNAVPNHLQTYRDRAGFSVMEDWNTVLYTCSSVNPSNLQSKIEGVEVLPIDETNLERVIEFDATVHGYRRDKIVSIAAKEQDTIQLAAMRDQVVTGYGIFHHNILGNIIVAPLYADDQETAELLMRKLIEMSPIAQEHGLTLMILDCNQAAVNLVQKLDLKRLVVLPRCYRKAKLPVNFSKIFVHHSLNFSPF